MPLAQADELAEPIKEGISIDQYIWLAAALAVLIVPFILGGWLAKFLKMPNYSTRLGLVLLAIIASSTVLINKRPSRGVDLQGGTILVYEIDQSKNIGEDKATGQRITSEDLVEPLSRRINPSGTKEIVIRPYGESQIEIIVPAKSSGEADGGESSGVGEVDELDRIKRRVEEAGILRFAILANRNDHQRIIDLAIEQSESDSQAERTSTVVMDVNGEIVGRWARVDQEKIEKQGVRPLRVNVGNAIVRNPVTGQLIDLPASVRGDNGEIKTVKWMQQEGLDSIETLMIVDPDLDIKGDDLAFAASTFDQNGAPAVAFNLTDEGSGRFFALTTNNAPVGTMQRQLGIVLDDDLLSAPNILQPIRKEGRITGSFTKEEVQDLVAVLKAGQLPAALTPQPIAENQIDPTLGKDTINKGFFAIGLSLSLVLVFILFYYRFAGVVACIALVLNLAMILGTMVLINQPLTLPGLAGLVLTVGMSVDANVLIFERIREELKKGAAPRMSIRNGFAKATVTIVDANLTTLITAIVLYAIGTDQIRGFAVTLILGILYSMFTAIYMSRTFFDIAERHGFLTLSMSDGVNSLRGMFTRGDNFDFMGKGKIALVVSSLLVVIGISSIFARGQGIFDIDFAGGSSVQFRVDKPTETDTIREIVGEVMVGEDGQPIQFTVNGVTMESSPDGTVYKVDSSYEQVDQLKNAISEAFAKSESVNLVTYRIDISPTDPDAPLAPKSSSLKPSDANGTKLAVFYPQDEAETDTVAVDEEDAEAESTTPAISDRSTIVYSTALIKLGIEGEEGGAGINAPTLVETLVNAAKAVNVPLNERGVELTPIGEGADKWNTKSSLSFSEWTVKLPLEFAQADAIMEQIKDSLGNKPVWISSSSVGGQVAGDMIGRALGALFGSLLCIIGYIWFRFQRVMYGLAAVVALLHDVIVTLGAIAVSYWLADALGFLLIDPFKISLTVVAALLTIIGYSLNDTIVVFDRIRETKGKSTHLTGEMINTSINQTLSRTLLTSITTLIVVVLLYTVGGAGIHAFAFALVVGVLVGTYSSIFVASPVLLYLIQRNERVNAA
ncbi:protein translocase subunit SecD [Novipirellula maiorica]|nr:protein translocase subunit SecD [Rhodopirellula maiorica]